MDIQVKAGMKFRHHPIEKGNEFEVIEHDFYDDGNPILCATTDRFIYPLDEINLSEYVPMVDGKWVYGKKNYVY